jgi:hypothetical protein
MGGQQLFISHANEDEAVVNRIVAYLEGRGVSCWISGRDIPPRAIYAEAITSGIRDSGACGVIVSAAANASAAIKRELELASHYGKPFVPIRVDATEPGPGLDYYLRNTQWINYGRDGDRALDRIVTDMASGGPAPTAQQPYTPPPAGKPTKSSKPPIIAIAAIVALAVVGAGGWYSFTSWQHANDDALRLREQLASVQAATEGASETAAAAPSDTESEAERAARDTRAEHLQRERVERERRVAGFRLLGGYRAFAQARFDHTKWAEFGLEHRWTQRRRSSEPMILNEGGLSCDTTQMI